MAADPIEKKLRQAFDGIVNPQPRKKKRETKAEKDRSHKDRVTERRIRKLIRG